jgi:hypothetical protein
MSPFASLKTVVLVGVVSLMSVVTLHKDFASGGANLATLVGLAAGGDEMLEHVERRGARRPPRESFHQLFVEAAVFRHGMSYLLGK